MRWFFLILIAICFEIVGISANAGIMHEVKTTTRCTKAIYPGKPILGGINTGQLPRFAIIRRCGGGLMSISYAGKKFQSIATMKFFIPNYKSRSKAHAMPDMRMAIANKKVREAWLTRPTLRYDHGILGDNIEAGGFAVKTNGNVRLEYLLDKNSVFEDRIARLTDLDGDGENEIVVVRSYLEHGAALAVFAVVDLEIIQLAETAAIGLSHRWLNPVAVADFDGDGKVEIAWVETPHIGGILKVARLTGKGKKRKLKTLSKLPGFSNHVIGSRELQQSVTFDWDGDGLSDIILPGAARRTIKVVSMSQGKLRVIDEMNIDGKIGSALIAADLDGDGKGEVLLITKDGRLLSFSAVR